MKKLKEIVEVLSQIAALKCPAQDGGPGSGIKGHTTAESENSSMHSKLKENLVKQYSQVLEHVQSGKMSPEEGQKAHANIARQLGQLEKSKNPKAVSK